MHKDITKYLKQFSDDLTIVNKLIVEAYLTFNKIKKVRNQLIKKYIKGNNKKQVIEFIELIKEKNEKFDLEDLIRLFEITIPSTDIIANGAVYTPEYIREYIVNYSLETSTFIDNNSIKIGDISCGAGAFLYSVANKIRDNSTRSFYQIFKENIFGLDISHYAIERTKILLTLLAVSKGEDREYFDFNLFVGNALDFDWNKNVNNFIGFDIIVGNPPYVRSKNIDINTQKLMSKWEVTKSGNSDLYIPFFEIALKYLKDKVGILGYITVNTFKRSLNARKLRSYFSLNKLNLSIIDFGNYQVFNKKSTYTCIVFVKKDKKEFLLYEKIEPKNINKKRNYSKIEYSLLDDKKGWLLNKSEILTNIKKIESIGNPLGKKYSIKNGLATLCNDIFIFKPTNEDETFYYIDNNKIEKSICRDIIKPNILKFEEDIDKLKEKIIFPYTLEVERNKENKYISKVKVFNEEYFKQTYPNAYNYLEYHKEKLLSRDKGKSSVKYKWYEFGRTQALADYGAKLFFPYMSNKPYFVYSSQKDLLFYAGYAIFVNDKSQREIDILKIILKSKVFWYYIENSSKPYSGNFYALAKNYVKDFGICNLTKKEEDFLLSSSKEEVDDFLIKKYQIQIQ